jgi:uncharacterized damage-inducible protein DinB
MNFHGDIKLQRIADFWFNGIKPPLMQALEVTPDDKLDWMPADKMLTLGNIFMHINEASDWWINRVIYKKEYKDMTPCKSPSKDYIKTLLDDHWIRMERFFDKAPKILEEKYSLDWFKPPKTVDGYWIMLHLFEHDLHHRSQINQYLRILGEKPPRI